MKGPAPYCTVGFEDAKIWEKQKEGNFLTHNTVDPTWTSKTHLKPEANTKSVFCKCQRFFLSSSRAPQVDVAGAVERSQWEVFVFRW